MDIHKYITLITDTKLQAHIHVKSIPCERGQKETNHILLLFIVYLQDDYYTTKDIV